MVIYAETHTFNCWKHLTVDVPGVCSFLAEVNNSLSPFLLMEVSLLPSSPHLSLVDGCVQQ